MRDSAIRRAWFPYLGRMGSSISSIFDSICPKKQSSYGQSKINEEYLRIVCGGIFYGQALRRASACAASSTSIGTATRRTTCWRLVDTPGAANPPVFCRWGQFVRVEGKL